MAEAQAEETSPLLGSRNVGDDTSHQSAFLTVQRVRQKNGEASNFGALLICGLLFFTVDFASYMRVAPTNRMLELSFCRTYYEKADPSQIGRDGTVPEDACKLVEIQRQLALLKGWLGLLESIPGLLLAVPYGLLAKIYGTKLVATLGLSGQIMGDIWIWVVCYRPKLLPIQMAMFSSLFRCIGGGSSVMSSVVLAMVASFASSSDRTRAVFYMAVAMLTSELLSPPLGSLLMSKYGPYAPYLSGIPLEMLGFIILYLLPASETSAKNDPITFQVIDTTADHGRNTWPRRIMITSVMHTRTLATYLVNRPGLLVLLLAFMVNKLSRQIEEIMIQYVTVRFGWTLAQSGYLISILAAMHITLFCLALPQIHKSLMPIHGLDVNKVDLLVAKGSTVFLVLGPLIMGLAPHPAVLIGGLMLFTAGSGFRQSLQSFLTGSVEPEEITLLYTSISILDSLGSLVAAPLLGSLLAAGIHIGGIALGLPFFAAAALYGVSAIGVWHVRMDSV